MPMQSMAPDVRSGHAELLARVEALEAQLAATEGETEAAVREAMRAERERDALPPVRPHANSLLAYFVTMKAPPVPEVPDEPDVEAVRSERSAARLAHVDPYRDDAAAARVRVAQLEEQLDQEKTRCARAWQRMSRAARERDRRAERARLDEEFTNKELLQLLLFFAFIAAIVVILYALGL